MNLKILFLSLSSLFSLTPYEMTDLDTLYKESNYQEFLSHALDIRPSQRNSIWKKMVTEISESFIKEKIIRKDFNEKTLAFIENLSNWPVLKQDEFFFLRRNEYGVKYFEECFRNNQKDYCFESIDRFWRNTSLKNPEFGLNLANLLMAQGYQGNLWDLVALASNSDVGEFYCRDKLVQKEILKKAQIIMSQDLSPIEQKVSIQNLVNESCLKSLIPEIKNAFIEINSSVNKEFYLKFLMLTGQLSLEELEYFHTLYFLQGPVIGDLFNESWKTIENLGQNYNRRKIVFDRLKTLNMLPDEIFSSKDHKKKETMLSHFYKNFPEYLDFYAHTCIDYLEGKKNFPKGNPTLRCKDLFMESEGKDLIEPSLQSKYKALIKFERKA